MAININKITDVMDKAVEQFNKDMPAAQKKLLSVVLQELKDLKLQSNGQIVVNTSNIKLLLKVQSDIQKLVLNNQYLDSLKDFTKAFTEVNNVQNDFFKSILDKFKPPVTAKLIKQSAIESMLSKLTDGIQFNVSNAIMDTIRTAVTSGQTYGELTSALQEQVLNTSETDGILYKYAKQVATDSINQYAGQYNNIVTADLGLTWLSYTGSLIATSRTWCEALIKRAYIHVSELNSIIQGDFKEFKDLDGKIYEKTGLPEGMYAGTNAQNIMTLRGGYNCGHQLSPVSEFLVKTTQPAIYNRVIESPEYKSWLAKNRKK